MEAKKLTSRRKFAESKAQAVRAHGQISTTNQKSPQRCTVTLTATGPSNPQLSPLDGSNNTTELVIDVLDKND